MQDEMMLVSGCAEQICQLHVEAQRPPQSGEDVSYISHKRFKCRSQMICGLLRSSRCCGSISAQNGLSYSLAFGKFLHDGGCC